MKTKMIIILLVISMIISLPGCFTPVHPIYERSDTEESGITVNMDGVIYKMYPKLKWEVHPDDNLIGYAGSHSTGICLAKGDTEKNFIYLQDAGASMYYTPLHRTDKVIPEPSKDTVDKIRWSEYKFKDNLYESDYSNIVEDKDAIKSLLESLNADKRIADYTNFENYRIDIYCYSSIVPGAVYQLSLMISNRRLVCGSLEEGYVEIPVDLLEKIAGHKINVAELLS